jgi:hypothetical protein
MTEPRIPPAPIYPQMCEPCGGGGCPYCSGPEADYHTMCIECPDCKGTGRIDW